MRYRALPSLLLAVALLPLGWLGLADRSSLASLPTPATQAKENPLRAQLSAPAPSEENRMAQRIAPSALTAQEGWVRPGRATPPRLTFHIPHREPLTFEKEGTRTLPGREVWKGRHPDLPGAFAVVTGSASEWTALIVVPGQPTYEIVHFADGRETVNLDEATLRCGSCLGGTMVAAPVSTQAMLSPGGTAAVTGTVVDVVFIYDSRALVEAGGNSETVTNRLINRLESGNQILANSGVTNFNWAFAGAFEVQGYTRTGLLQDDLVQLSDPTSPVGSFAQEKADLTGADQVVLVVGDPIDWGGLAWMPGNEAVLGWSQTPYYTLVHELAHNFNCNHDRSTAGAADNNGKYNYGIRFSLGGVETGTIMSYADQRIPYFSNPDLTHAGQSLGIPAGQAKAADNARVLRERAASLAATRKPASRTAALTSHPQGRNVVAGTSVNLSVTATGSGLSYQWNRNGQPLPGANSSTLALQPATSLDAGTYQCVVTAGATQLTSAPAEVEVSPLWTSNPLGRLINLSTRSLAQQGAKAQIAGFALSGSGDKEILVRANGPSLTSLGLAGAVQDPVLELRNQSNGGLMGSNDQWSSEGQGNALTLAFGRTGAFPWLTGSRDAALLHRLTSGGFSGVVSNQAGAEGLSLIEVYETDPTTDLRLVNLSTRSLVGRGGEAQIAGFVLGGSGLKTLLIRASGPALGPYLPGTAVVQDPFIRLFRQGASEPFATNDDWGNDQEADLLRAAQASGAFPWTRGSLDAALLVTLPAGAYSAMVQTQDETAIGLIEVYDVNR